jgi:hypothetical protein
MTTLTEVFPCFFLSCKANARVKPAKTGHGRTLPNFCVVLCIFVLFCVLYVVLCIVCFVSFSVLFVCICVLNYSYRVATQLQLNISYHIIYHVMSCHNTPYHISCHVVSYHHIMSCHNMSYVSCHIISLLCN